MLVASSKMFHTRLLICLSLVALFLQTVVSQCLPLEKHNPLNIKQCQKAFGTYKFDKQGLLDSNEYKNKKTCGNCAISMSQVSTIPGAIPKQTLDGYTKQSLNALLGNLAQKCTIRGKNNSMLPAIYTGFFQDGTTFFTFEIEAGDLRENECSSRPKKPRNWRPERVSMWNYSIKKTWSSNSQDILDNVNHDDTNCLRFV